MPENELKRLVEAVMFSSARAMSVAELAKLCRRSENDILAVLTLWKKELEESQSPTLLVEDNNGWKLTVHEKYIPVVKKVVTKTELPKTILETLAIVAYKVPVMQSKVILLRTNKAYEHLAFLEQIGFISREKKGRSKLIRLTPKFYEYFSIDPARLHEKFQKMGDLESAISAKEKEHEEIEAEQRRQAEQNLEGEQVKLAETYDAVEPVEELEPTSVEVYTEKIGELEVYYESERTEVKEAIKEIKEGKLKKGKAPGKKQKTKTGVSEAQKEETEKESKKAEESEKSEKPEMPPEFSYEETLAKELEAKTEKLPPKEFTSEGLYPKGMPPDIEKKVDERVKEILEGEKEE